MAKKLLSCEWHHPDSKYGASPFIIHLRLSLWTWRSLVPVYPCREHYVSPAALRLAHKAVISLQRTSKEYSLFGKLALWSTNHCSKRSLVSSLCVETLVCYTRWVTVLSSPAVHWKQKLWQKSNMNEWNKQSAGVDMEMHYFLPFLAKCKCLRTAATQSQSSRPCKAVVAECWCLVCHSC